MVESNLADHRSTDRALERAFIELDGELRDFVGRRAGANASDEVMSDIWHAALLATREGQEIGRSWLWTVAKHKVVDHWRRMDRRRRLLDDARDSAHLTAPAVGISDVDVVMGELVARDRSLLGRHYLAGYPLAAIASQDGTTRRAAESALARARKRFRDEYGDRSGTFDLRTTGATSPQHLAAVARRETTE